MSTGSAVAFSRKPWAKTDKTNVSMEIIPIDYN